IVSRPTGVSTSLLFPAQTSKHYSRMPVAGIQLQSSPKLLNRRGNIPSAEVRFREAVMRLRGVGVNFRVERARRQSQLSLAGSGEFVCGSGDFPLRGGVLVPTIGLEGTHRIESGLMIAAGERSLDHLSEGTAFVPVERRLEDRIASRAEIIRRHLNRYFGSGPGPRVMRPGFLPPRGGNSQRNVAVRQHKLYGVTIVVRASAGGFADKNRLRMQFELVDEVLTSGEGLSPDEDEQLASLAELHSPDEAMNDRQVEVTVSASRETQVDDEFFETIAFCVIHDSVHELVQ